MSEFAEKMLVNMNETITKRTKTYMNAIEILESMLSEAKIERDRTKKVLLESDDGTSHASTYYNYMVKADHEYSVIQKALYRIITEGDPTGVHAFAKEELNDAQL